MKKRINILMSISIVCAAASTSAIAAMCSISNNSTKKYNEAKSRLLNLIKKLDNEGQKIANDFIARQDKKFNSTAFKNHSNTSKLIDEIEIFSKKILENLQKDEKQRLEELNKLNKLRLDLQNLINSNDGQNVDSFDAKKALNENQIDDSLPIDKIKKTNENLENAKKELLNKINAEKELQSKIFNDKKQELKRVLDLEDAKEVDFAKEQKVYIETNISEASSIEDIKNKIIEVEKATSSLTSKILNTKQQELQRFENIKKDLQDFINTKLNDAKYQSIKQKALDKINSLNGINDDSTIKEIKAGQNALIKAKEEAGREKEKLDGQNIKDTLKETINNAKEFKKLLIDNDQKIVDLKSNLDNEISKAEQSLSKDKESMESANDLLNTKLIEYKEILNKFNQEKEAKFNELKQTRSQIEAFINENKTNPNYADLIAKLTDAKKAKESVSESSNKSEIIAANEALQQALQTAQSAKAEADRTNGDAKAKLSTSLTTAKELVKKLVDSDGKIQQAKTQLDQEIQKAESAIASNNTAAIQALQKPFDTKISEIQNQLTEFNKDKTNKFNELEQTRSQIEEFIDSNKNNSNYADLIEKLANVKKAKESVSESSNKSDIIAANNELKQALEKAKVAKEQIDDANKSIKEQLNDSIANANQLLNKLADSDQQIQKAKAELNQEIQNANQAVTSNDNVSMQSTKEALDAKVAEITKKLETFNKEKEAKFAELEQTRSQIQEFVDSNKNNSTYSNIISKLTTTKNEKDSVSESSNKSDIESANTLLTNSLKEANDKKQEIDKFVSAKKELEEFIENDEDAKSDELVSNLNDAKQELEKFSGINDSCEITEIKKATDDLTTAKTKLEEEIKNKKQELFNAFELSKTTLQNYITNDIKDSKYKIIQDKFNNIIDEYKNITSNDKISKIKDATNNLNAKFTEIGSNKAILDKFYELKPKLEDLLNTANLKDDAKSINIDLSSEDQASTNAKAINNSSTIENVEQVNQKLQAAIDKLTKDIQKINEDKKAKFEEFKTEKQHLEDIIKTKGLDKFINIDDEIKSIKQQIDEEIKKHKINENSKISDILAAKNSIDETQRKLLGSLDNYSTQRTESIESYNNQKTELSSLINSNNNFKQLEESKKTEFNNKKQEYEDLNLETLSKNKIQEKSQEIKELIANINKEISDAKKQEYLNFDKAKKELEKYINDELNNQKYDSIKKEAQNKIDSFSAIKEESLSTKEIQEIKDATNALIKAKTNAEQEKAKIDAKEQLNAKIQEADKLKEELIDSDSTITTLKTNLEKEIANAKEALKKDTKAIIEAKEQLANKIDEFKSSLDEFNKQKETKFKELEKTRKDINDFLTDNVKNNPNYAELVKKLQNSLKTQEKINKTSNKANIIAANNELTKALQEAKVAKEQADRANGEANNKLTTSLSAANELLKKLTDSDAEIQNYKKQLEKEIEKANNAITSKNTKSLTDSNNSLTNKTNEIQEKLNKFIELKNKEYEKLEKTRKDIDEFIKQIENDPQTKKNYQNIVKNLKDKKAEKNSINENSNKKDIVNANTELQNSLNEAKEQKSEIDKFYAAKKDLETLISTPDAKKVGTSETQDLLNKKKTINDSTDKETIKNATKELNDAKTNLEQKIKDKKNELLKDFNNAKDDLENYQVSTDVSSLDNFDEISFYKPIQKVLDLFNNNVRKIDENSTIEEIETSIKTLKDTKANAIKEEEKYRELAKLHKTIEKAESFKKELESELKNNNDHILSTIKNDLNSAIEEAKTIKSDDAKIISDGNNKLESKISYSKEAFEKFKEYKKLEQTRKDIDEFIKQIENDHQTKGNYLNIVENLKNKKAGKNSITFSNNKKEIQDAYQSLQNELNNAKITKKDITDFHNSKNQLEGLIKTDDAKKVGTTEADTILTHYKNISDASKNEEIKQATQKINDIKKIIETKIQEKKRNEFSKFESIKNDLQSFINKDLKDQKYNSIRTKIEDKIKGVSNINKNSKIQDIENAKIKLESAKNEFDRIINNIKEFNSQKQKVEEKLNFLDTENIGTSGSLSNKNKNIKAIFQGFITEMEKELINKNADNKAKDECIKKIEFLDKALISRYEGILKASYKFFEDASTQNNQTEKNEFFDNLCNDLVDQKVFDQLEKMNMLHFEDFYNTFYNKGNAPEEVKKQNELEGPAVKWSAFDDILENAFVRTLQTSFIKKCENLFSHKTEEYYGTINRKLNVYNIDIYSKTGRPNPNDLDLRDKDKIFKGYKDVTFEFSTENVPGRWQKNFKGLAKWEGEKNRYRFVGIVSINWNYEYDLVISTKGENHKKTLSLEYKLGSNEKGKNYNPIIIDKISGIN
ncbi:hypothetical protein HDJGFE_02210 [Metamycoplasma hominis]|uniref:hypothetical protein n=1 Tax=Metamycoplasma hominis TaxID=2098 RepID=UPI0027358B71|nr:hypothetical protein [Metamycoplasma hominis]